MEVEFEPIFCSMAVYDAREKAKLSENFYFDMNPEYIRKMLQNHVPYEDASSKAKSAVFSITYPSSDIFLVIKVQFY